MLVRWMDIRTSKYEDSNISNNPKIAAEWPEVEMALTLES